MKLLTTSAIRTQKTTIEVIICFIFQSNVDAGIFFQKVRTWLDMCSASYTKIVFGSNPALVTLWVCCAFRQGTLSSFFNPQSQTGYRLLLIIVIL